MVTHRSLNNLHSFHSPFFLPLWLDDLYCFVFEFRETIFLLTSLLNFSIKLFSVQLIYFSALWFLFGTFIVIFLLDCSPPGSSVHEIFQVRILEWVAISFSRGSSQPRSPALQADPLPTELQGKDNYSLFTIFLLTSLLNFSIKLF